ncbi:hypothetical protein O181_056500 [Austropuccinia psidii MF-1]|uniref:Integrase catalytic domain-containing protein n=1 Tax=Austropuccinia psidii MF-1 TaxID=1389203 RepID=A0A9Q3ECS7_9BASI|nr:hypothetical protein [Austropuccinia psidii MF-1]
MVQVLAFYVLRLLPETCRHVSTAVFHSIKVSAKIPTVEELFKEIKLDILRQSGTDEQTSLALQLRFKPKKKLCHKGKHNPLANHSESNCFQLFPEKREAYHRRRNNKSQPVVGSALAVCNNVNSVSNKPVLDSGCSNTIAPTSDLFSNISPSKEILLAANGSDMKVTSEGTFHLNTTTWKILIPNSLVVPLASSVLVSLGPFINKGATLKGFKGGSNLFDRNGSLILSTKIVNNVLLINTPISNIALSSSAKIPLIIHKTLGHPNNQVASKMMPDVDFSNLSCESCSLAKSHRLPFSGTVPSPHNVLDVVHMDLCGPISPASRGGNKYIFQIIDGYSHMRFVYLLSSKSECFDSFVKFQNLVENLKEQTIKTVVSDNGGEFINAKFKNLFDLKGILHLPTAPYTPQQNPVSERGNWSLLERIRVMMLDNCVPFEWWGEALAMAAFLLNRTPVSTLDFVAPLSKWDSSVALHLDGLHPFGCTAIMNSPKPRRKSKIGPTGTLCMLVGIQEGHRNYRLFDAKTGYIHISHHCIFKDEEAFCIAHSLTLSPSVQEPLLLPSIPLFNFSSDGSAQFRAREPDISEEAFPEGTPAKPQATPTHTSNPPIPSVKDASSIGPPLVVHPESVSTLENGGSLPKGWTYDTVPVEAPCNIDKHILGGGRSRKTPARFDGAVVNKAPCSFREAMSSSESNDWLLAVQNEFASLERHEVLEEVELQKNLRLLDTTWVFREKTDALGNVMERKARLCVQGFLQVENLDFHQTFAPTGRLSTLRFLLGYCAYHNFDLHQMDVKTAFLHGNLDEDLFIRLPEGYRSLWSGPVCLKLKKSLYGLKQSPRNWYLKIKEFFVSAGFRPSAADPCLLIKNSTNPCFVFLHVDDLVIGGTNLDDFRAQISSVFDMKDLGKLCYVLGMKVTRNQIDRVVFLSQELYINTLLESFDMMSWKTVSTPQVPSSRLLPLTNTGSEPAKIHYRRAVGLLNYLVACTRPDLAYSASCLSQFLSLPSYEHELAFKHVLRYLKGTSTWGLWLGRIDDSSSIIGYCDSDWGSNYNSRSFSGSCIFLYGLVGWKTTKQEVVALSSTEAEYRSISTCCQDVCWLLELVSELGLSVKASLSCDNQGALALLKNPLYQHRTRHIKLRLHWCRQLLEEGVIDVKYISTALMPANILTKSLCKGQHHDHCSALGLSSFEPGRVLKTSY